MGWRAIVGALALGVCFAPASALSKEPAIPKSVLVESARAVSGGRATQVVVGQAELGANINPSYAMVAMGGGVLGALIDAKIQSDRGKRASVGITPIRDALMDFDADQKAIETTQAALATLPWFEASAPAFTHDPTPAARTLFFKDATTEQVAFFGYTYDLSPDFSAIRLGVSMQIGSKGDGAEQNLEKRLAPKNLVYAQTLTSVVQLPNPTTPEENSKRWAADQGRLAHQAMEAAFKNVETLIPRALTLTPDDVTKMGQGEKRTLGPYAGKLVETGDGGTLLFNGGLVHVQTLAD